MAVFIFLLFAIYLIAAIYGVATGKVKLDTHKSREDTEIWVEEQLKNVYLEII